MNKALLVVDVQNDYFSGGALPQWQADAVAERIGDAIRHAQKHGWLIVNIQHIAKEADAMLFAAGSDGVAVHDSVAGLLSEAPLVVKAYADAFMDTDLTALLQAQDVQAIYLVGMMTQNCITHTALSPSATPYEVTVLSDCCSAPYELVHHIAIKALSARCHVQPQL